MLLRRFTDFVLRGRVQAMAVAFICTFIPLLGSLSILIAGLVTLRKGAWEGFLVVIAATLPYLLNYYAKAMPADMLPLIWLVLGFAIISNVLTWLFAVILRQVGSWSVTLELGVLLGIVVIGLVHASFADIQQSWATYLNTYLTKTAVVDQAGLPTEGHPDMQAQLIAAAKHYATGFCTLAVLFNVFLQLMLARWWQAVMFNPGGLRKELYRIRYSRLLGLIFAAGLVLTHFKNPSALDAMPVLYAAFFMAGLSLLHCFLGTQKHSWLWLGLMYAGIILLFPVSIVVVSIIALFDVGIDFRKRFAF